MLIQNHALPVPPAEDGSPPRLRALLAGLSSAIRGASPGARVRVTYAPFQNIDAFIEVETGAAPPPRVDPRIDPAFRLAERDGYTVAILLRAGAGPAGHVAGARCRW
jgi:hypothetical protein